MFFQLHPNAKIGYKSLSDADLGQTGTSHQTHIGLLEGSLDFLRSVHKKTEAQLIYESTSKKLVCLLDFIQNPDGTYRSPKIRTGEPSELHMNGIAVNSVMREIRQICAKNPKLTWYLMWFGIENEELVFFLFSKDSADFSKINGIVDPLSKNGVIAPSQPFFTDIIRYLNNKVNQVNAKYLEELEIFVQTNETEYTPLDIIRPRVRDIEKANELFKQNGRKGEQLINEYLAKLKHAKEISNFKWMNQSRESGYPYDFEIHDTHNILFYSDVKSTSYLFNQKMIFSKGEMKFINQNKNYHIHRVYDLANTPKFRECGNIHEISGKFVRKLGVFSKLVAQDGFKVADMKIGISPARPDLSFAQEIII